MMQKASPLGMALDPGEPWWLLESMREHKVGPESLAHIFICERV